MRIDGYECLFWSLSALADEIKAKRISPVEVTEKLLSRIHEIDQTYNSYITVMEETAREAAQKAETEIMGGNYRGPLHGVPIGLKDIINTKNARTTMGSEIFKDYIPDSDATVVEKLEQAGAIIIGKLNTHQFAYGPTGDRSYFGPARNPLDPTKITGGSSSGSGASVAAYLNYGALGTDTSGSIRIPATLCGIVGMKPTFGRVSKYGVFPLSWTLDHVGPMTRTVRDNALMLNVLSGYDEKDPYSVKTEQEDFTRGLEEGIKGAVVGVPTNFYFDHLDPVVAEKVSGSLNLLRELGAEVRELEIDRLEEISQSQQLVLKSDAYAIHKERREGYPDQWDEEVKERLLLGADIKAYEYARAQQMRHVAVQSFQKAMENVSVLVTPSLPILAPDIGQRELDLPGYEGQHIRWALIRLPGPTNVNGFPSLTVPCGYSDAGLPVGLQFIGRPFDEATLYRFGHAFEQALGLGNRLETFKTI
jgi:aspartyl-tRNA(Asn)/glutamyl-tRNA(Gln) amidotransferase subunit A